MNTAMNATPVTRLDLSSLNAEAWDFALRQQTLHLATCDAAGLPEASYAPYVEQGRELYVYVSEIARHWRNLAASGRCAVTRGSSCRRLPAAPLRGLASVFQPFASAAAL